MPEPPNRTDIVCVMSDTGTTYSTPWAELIATSRATLRMTPTKFALQVGGVTRQTIYRWEDGTSTPDQHEVIAAVAKGLHIDISVALKAAGVDPNAGQEHAQARDKEEDALRIIRESDVSPAVKAELIRHLEERRAEHERARVREIELLLKTARKV